MTRSLAFVVKRWKYFTWHMMNKWLSNFAYKIEITGWVFVVTGLIILLVAALSIGYRTIQAALANPVNSLRNE